MKLLKDAGRRLWKDVYNLRFALLGIAAYFLTVHLLFGQFCPMVILFRFPCPGCGMTRAFRMVLPGQWKAAWELQPLVYGWLVLGVWFGITRYICGRKSKALNGFLIVLLAGTIGVYFWRLLTGFPAELLIS